VAGEALPESATAQVLADPTLGVTVIRPLLSAPIL
jgi:hypothetical protein